VGSSDNTWLFHADAIATFLRRDTVTCYGITLALPIIIINVILRNARIRDVRFVKERKRRKKKWFIIHKTSNRINTNYLYDVNDLLIFNEKVCLKSKLLLDT